MSNSQMLLHSEHFELCRMCLLQPENDRHMKFINIFEPNSDCNELSRQIWDNLGVKVEKNDIKPKLICEKCHKLLSDWIELKKTAAVSQTVCNYIASIKFGVKIPGFSLSSLDKSDTLLGSINNAESTNASNCQNKMNKSSNNDAFSSVEVNVNDEIFCVESDNEELAYNNCKNNLVNDSPTFEELIYCSICKSKNTFDHDCSNNIKEFSTCLVPDCNILSRSLKDLTPHYREHIGMTYGEKMCLHCFKEKKRSECDIYGFHTRCDTVNLFKCFTCNTIFNTMPKLASHKLKTHDSQLINFSGNYSCFYCEKSSSDLKKIDKHIKLCRENQTKNDKKKMSVKKE